MVKRLKHRLFKFICLSLTILLVAGVSEDFSSAALPNEMAGTYSPGGEFSSCRIQADATTQKSNPFPEKPVPVSGEKDEREKANEKEWIDSDFFHTNNYFGLVFIDQSDLAISRLEKAISNRKTILLFILYHTWKSYLS